MRNSETVTENVGKDDALKTSQLTCPVVPVEKTNVPFVRLVKAGLEDLAARPTTLLNPKESVVEQRTELHQTHRPHELSPSVGVHDAGGGRKDENRCVIVCFP